MTATHLAVVPETVVPDTVIPPGANHPTARELSEGADAIADSRAESTRRNIQWAFRTWTEFCEADGQDPETLFAPNRFTPLLVARFLRQFAEGRTVGSVRVVRAGLSAAFREATMLTEKPPTDPTKNELVSRAVKGLARQRMETQKQAPAVRLADLERILITTEKSGDRLAARDGALMGVMWWTLMRVSEAVNLRWGDLEDPPDGPATVTIRKSKTDQEGRGVTVALPEPAARLLKAWAFEAPQTDCGRMFPITTSAASRAIRKRAAAAGLKASSHSLRVGAATTLADAGYSLSDLQVAGRWANSRMAARYTAQRDAANSPMMRFAGGK